MGEALRQAADGLTLREAGNPADGGHARLAEAFRVEPSHRPLVCWAVEGGTR